MSEGFSAEAVVSFIRHNLFLSVLSAVGLLLLLFGFFGLGFLEHTDSEVTYESATTNDESPVKATSAPVTLYIDISGAVAKPGVYEVSSTARVQDVLTKAGGLSSKADTQGIAKRINLAAKVADGMKLYFPFKGEPVTTEVLGISSTDNLTESTGGASTQTGGLINVNLASQSELESLPGIGEVTAQKIIKSRPYGSVSDLKDRKVVGESVYGKIQNLVTVQ